MPPGVTGARTMPRSARMTAAIMLEGARVLRGRRGGADRRAAPRESTLSGAAVRGRARSGGGRAGERRERIGQADGEAGRSDDERAGCETSPSIAPCKRGTCALRRHRPHPGANLAALHLPAESPRRPVALPAQIPRTAHRRAAWSGGLGRSTERRVGGTFGRNTRQAQLSKVTRTYSRLVSRTKVLRD